MTSQECNIYDCEDEYITAENGASLNDTSVDVTPYSVHNNQNKAANEPTEGNIFDSGADGSVHNSHVPPPDKRYSPAPPSGRSTAANTSISTARVTPAAVERSQSRRSGRLQNVNRPKVVDIFNNVNIVQQPRDAPAAAPTTPQWVRTTRAPTTTTTTTLAPSYYMWIPLFWDEVTS